MLRISCCSDYLVAMERAKGHRLARGSVATLHVRKREQICWPFYKPKHIWCVWLTASPMCKMDHLRCSEMGSADVGVLDEKHFAICYKTHANKLTSYAKWRTNLSAMITTIAIWRSYGEYPTNSRTIFRHHAHLQSSNHVIWRHTWWNMLRTITKTTTQEKRNKLLVRDARNVKHGQSNTVVRFLHRLSFAFSLRKAQIKETLTLDQQLTGDVLWMSQHYGHLKSQGWSALESSNALSPKESTYCLFPWSWLHFATSSWPWLLDLSFRYGLHCSCANAHTSSWQRLCLKQAGK